MRGVDAARGLLVLLFAASLAPPQARARIAVHNRGVPILMYHVISVAPAHAPFPELYVRPRDFRAQMAWLADHGYRAVTLQRVYDYWKGDAPLPARPVVVTFDDGYLSQYTHAFPTLEAHRWPGVLNMEVNFLMPAGGLHPWRVRKLIAAGWELDAHTLTHPDLTTLGVARLWREVNGSRIALRREFHVPVDFFCYPEGRYNADVVAAARRAGFLGATTTNYGLARPLNIYRVDRVRINGTDGLRGFAAKLTALTGRRGLKIADSPRTGPGVNFVSSERVQLV
jgi:peptidoglycan/xylan/chitin deacetylase (PgdA/CDA1 family)